MKTKKDPRLAIAEELSKAITKCCDKGIDQDYAAYIMFDVIGSLTIKHNGIKTFNRYVSEIKRNSK